MQMWEMGLTGETCRECELKPFLNGACQNERMLRNERLQLAGPLALVGAVACAEIAAQALGRWPISLLWYLDLDLLRPFRSGFDNFAIAPPLAADGFAPCLWVAAPLLGLIVTGLVARSRLPWAIASNLSFIYSGALLYGLLAENATATGWRAAPDKLATPSGLFAAAVLLVTLLSFTLSHWCYWRDIFASHGRSRFLATPSA